MANLRNRKPVSEMASQRMKQLMWEKVPANLAPETIWSEPALDETQLAAVLRARSKFHEMEDDFKVKQVSSKAVEARKRAKATERKSYLPLRTRQRMEMVLHRVKSSDPKAKHAAPQEVAQGIAECAPLIMDPSLLQELLSNYPESEVKGELGAYRNASAEELAQLHPADQLVVLLMTVPFLKAKVQGLLFKAKFWESFEAVQEGCLQVRVGSTQLMQAEHFKRLLNIVLMFGNFLNGTGPQGGAYGFKVSSINKLVETKAQDGTTLLHFVQRTVHSLFAETETFLEELEAPAAACRGTFSYVLQLPRVFYSSFFLFSPIPPLLSRSEVEAQLVHCSAMPSLGRSLATVRKLIRIGD